MPYLSHLIGWLSLFLTSKFLHKTWLYRKRSIFLGVFRISRSLTIRATDSKRHIGIQSPKRILRKPIWRELSLELCLPCLSLILILYHYITNWRWRRLPLNLNDRLSRHSLRGRSPIGNGGYGVLRISPIISSRPGRSWHLFLLGLRAEWLYGESLEVAEWLEMCRFHFYKVRWNMILK